MSPLFLHPGLSGHGCALRMRIVCTRGVGGCWSPSVVDAERQATNRAGRRACVSPALRKETETVRRATRLSSYGAAAPPLRARATRVAHGVGKGFRRRWVGDAKDVSSIVPHSTRSTLVSSSTVAGTTISRRAAHASKLRHASTSTTHQPDEDVAADVRGVILVSSG